MAAGSVHGISCGPKNQSFVIFFSSETFAQKFDLKLMTGPMGGSWYPLGGAISDAVQKEIPGVTIAVMPGAGIANVEALEFVFPKKYSKILQPIFTRDFDWEAKEENGTITVIFTPTSKIANKETSDVTSQKQA